MKVKLPITVTLPSSGTLNLKNTVSSKFVVNAGGTLSSDVVIKPQYLGNHGDEVHVRYMGNNLDVDGNKLILVDKDVSEVATENLYIIFHWVGSSWKPFILDFSLDSPAGEIVEGGVDPETGTILTAGITNGAITTPKLADGSVSPQKMTDESRRYTVTIPVDFSDGLDDRGIKIDHRFNIHKISYSIVVGPDNDSPTVNLSDGTNVIGVPLTIPRMGAPGNSASTTDPIPQIPGGRPSGFIYLTITSASTSGKVIISITIDK